MCAPLCPALPALPCPAYPQSWALSLRTASPVLMGGFVGLRLFPALFWTEVVAHAWPWQLGRKEQAGTRDLGTWGPGDQPGLPHWGQAASSHHRVLSAQSSRDHLLLLPGGGDPCSAPGDSQVSQAVPRRPGQAPVATWLQPRLPTSLVPSAGASSPPPGVSGVGGGCWSGGCCSPCAILTAVTQEGGFHRVTPRDSQRTTNLNKGSFLQGHKGPQQSLRPLSELTVGGFPVPWRPKSHCRAPQHPGPRVVVAPRPSGGGGKVVLPGSGCPPETLEPWGPGLWLWPEMWTRTCTQGRSAGLWWHWSQKQPQASNRTAEGSVASVGRTSGPDGASGCQRALSGVGWRRAETVAAVEENTQHPRTVPCVTIPWVTVQQN